MNLIVQADINSKVRLERDKECRTERDKGDKGQKERERGVDSRH